jgi:hypothetical protein
LRVEKIQGQGTPTPRLEFGGDFFTRKMSPFKFGVLEINCRSKNHRSRLEFEKIEFRANRTFSSSAFLEDWLDRLPSTKLWRRS